MSYKTAKIKAKKINNEIKMTKDARIEWIIMICKGICQIIDHNRNRKNDVD